jgi:hypothetical protein
MCLSSGASTEWDWSVASVCMRMASDEKAILRVRAQPAGAHRRLETRFCVSVGRNENEMTGLSE